MFLGPPPLSKVSGPATGHHSIYIMSCSHIKTKTHHLFIKFIIFTYIFFRWKMKFQLKPKIFGSCKTLLLASRKNCRVIELSSISSKTVELSNYRVYRAKLSSYRTIEYIEQNCQVIGLFQCSTVFVGFCSTCSICPITRQLCSKCSIAGQFCSIYSIVRLLDSFARYTRQFDNSTVLLDILDSSITRQFCSIYSIVR